MDNLFKSLSLDFPDTSFEVEFWDGSKQKYNSGNNKFKLILKNKESLSKVLAGGSLGFGEEFMKGNIQIEGNLQDFLKLLYGGTYSNIKLSLGNKLKIFLNYIFSLGTISKSRKNISYHYDLGNEFYSLWLDPTLTYSCAYFKGDQDTLQEAQLQKYEHIAKKLQLKPGETLVDIGCGWGGMMFYAAENYRTKCQGYTLSEEQYNYLVKEIKKRKLEDLVRVDLKDYREAGGQFDKFVSIGMFEHVGKKFYPIFFEVVKKLLKPGGLGLIQSIGSPKDKPSDPWITKYIFPGGHIPALWVILEAMSPQRLVFFDIEDLRKHYARTLDKWIENFEKNNREIKSLMIKKYNSRERAEEFIRMWQLYLNASSVSFKKGNNRLYQITFSNGINDQLPLTRNYIYGA